MDEDLNKVFKLELNHTIDYFRDTYGKFLGEEYIFKNMLARAFKEAFVFYENSEKGVIQDNFIKEIVAAAKEEYLKK